MTDDKQPRNADEDAAEADPDADVTDADQTDAGGGPTTEVARRDARRRRALDEVFGDVLPSVTGDESADHTGRRGSSDRQSDDRDDEIKRDVPPHHS